MKFVSESATANRRRCTPALYSAMAVAVFVATCGALGIGTLSTETLRLTGSQRMNTSTVMDNFLTQDFFGDPDYQPALPVHWIQVRPVLIPCSLHDNVSRKLTTHHVMNSVLGKWTPWYV